MFQLILQPLNKIIRSRKRETTFLEMNKNIHPTFVKRNCAKKVSVEAKQAPTHSHSSSKVYRMAMDSLSSIPKTPAQEALMAALKDTDNFLGAGDTSDEAFHGFTENPSFITMSLSHLRDGTCRPQVIVPAKSTKKIYI